MQLYLVLVLANPALQPWQGWLPPPPPPQSFLISCPNVVSSACICLSQLQGDGPQGVASIPFYELQQDRLDMPPDST